MARKGSDGLQKVLVDKIGKISKKTIQNVIQFLRKVIVGYYSNNEGEVSVVIFVVNRAQLFRNSNNFEYISKQSITPRCVIFSF